MVKMLPFLWLLTLEIQLRSTSPGPIDGIEAGCRPSQSLLDSRDHKVGPPGMNFSVECGLCQAAKSVLGMGCLSPLEHVRATNGTTDWCDSGTEMALVVLDEGDHQQVEDRREVRGLVEVGHPSLIAQSPHITSTKMSSARSLAAWATPPAWSSWVVSGMQWVPTLCFRGHSRRASRRGTARVDQIKPGLRSSAYVTLS